MILKRLAGLFALVLSITLVSALLIPTPALAISPAGGEAQVAVPHTPAGNQHSTGFCWAYALSGLIEAQALRESMAFGAAPQGEGRQVQLSAEYLGFYHMYFEIQKHLPWFHVVAARLANGGLEYADGTVEDVYQRVVVRNHFFTPSEGSVEPTALKEIAQIGIVPKSVFNVTFDAEAEKKLAENIKTFIKENLLIEENLAQFESVDANGINEALFTRVVKIFGYEPPRPDQSAAFTYDGQSFSPKSFLHDYLQFDPGAFTQISVSAETQETAIRVIAEVLNAGYAVPIGIPVYSDKSTSGSDFMRQAEDDADFSAAHCPNGVCHHASGGHEILIVNWTGDQAGLVKEFIAKNSWGFTGRNDRGEVTTDETQLGYYLIDTDYLRQTAYSARSISAKSDLWDFVIPNSFVDEFNKTLN